MYACSTLQWSGRISNKPLRGSGDGEFEIPNLKACTSTKIAVVESRQVPESLVLDKNRVGLYRFSAFSAITTNKDSAKGDVSA